MWSCWKPVVRLNATVPAAALLSAEMPLLAVTPATIAVFKAGTVANKSPPHERYATLFCVVTVKLFDVLAKLILLF